MERVTPSFYPLNAEEPGIRLRPALRLLAKELAGLMGVFALLALVGGGLGGGHFTLTILYLAGLTGYLLHARSFPGAFLAAQMNTCLHEILHGVIMWWTGAGWERFTVSPLGGGVCCPIRSAPTVRRQLAISVAGYVGTVAFGLIAMAAGAMGDRAASIVLTVAAVVTSTSLARASDPWTCVITTATVVAALLPCALGIAIGLPRDVIAEWTRFFGAAFVVTGASSLAVLVHLVATGRAEGSDAHHVGALLKLPPFISALLITTLAAVLAFIALCGLR
jgi:hypothetical protein